MTRYDESLSPDYDEPEGEPYGGAFSGGGARSPARSSSGKPLPKPPSGTSHLDLPAGNTPRPSSGAQLARWLADDDQAVPLVVLVDVKGTTAATSASPFAQQVHLLAQASGTAQGSGSETGGVLRISYGVGNVLRVVEADLRGGCYQLPPCSSAWVEAFLWLNGPRTVDVAAAIAPGTTDSPARLVNSFRTTLAVGATATEHVPFGARWLAVSGGNPTNIGSGQPAFSVQQGTRGPLILQDWVNGNFTAGPNTAVELANRDDLTLTNLGTTSIVLTTRFLLEL